MLWMRLKRYLPRGLYGRAALILLLPVVTLQLLVSIVFIQRHYEGVTEQMSRSILLEMRYVLAQIDAAPAAVSAEVAQDIGMPLGITIDLYPDPENIPVRDVRGRFDLSGRALVKTLRADFPEIRVFDLSDRHIVDLWIDSPRGHLKLSFDRSRVSASNPHQLIVIMVVLGALLTLISYNFLRNQLRPIKRLALAATEFGKGRVVPFNPTGAAEVRAAGTAFLDMRNRIERQTQSRTMMLSGISHDLRTPLTRLRLGLSLMDDVEAAPLIRDVDDMQHLVDVFLDFARDDALDDVVSCNPADILTQILDIARRSDHPVTRRDSTGTEDLQVRLRPMAIRRALDNLIGNALRYGTKAEISLHVSERALRFTVEDDGPGIAPQDREEALRPFTRLDLARNQDRGSGVGLGLAIVADIARVHGGSLRLGQSDALGGLQADLVIAR